jgi:FKBP-type peptidyl-prolyl cis-trans isomerase FklB
MIFMIASIDGLRAQDLSEDKAKLSYAIGWDIGQDIKQRGEEFDVEAIISAIRDSSAGSDPQVANEEMVSLLTDLQTRVRQEQQEAFEKLAEENQVKADEFLAANVSKTGIVALPSGVQYRIIDEGEGARPSMESSVRVHYRGSKMMKTGATWQIFVPPELAFGARGNPPVGPNEALVFDLKLVEIIE